jgi:hypothetical protein
MYDPEEQYRILREAIQGPVKPAVKPDWYLSMDQCEALLRADPVATKRLYRRITKPRAKRNSEKKAMVAGA